MYRCRRRAPWRRPRAPPLRRRNRLRSSSSVWASGSPLDLSGRDCLRQLRGRYADLGENLTELAVLLPGDLLDVLAGVALDAPQAAASERLADAADDDVRLGAHADECEVAVLVRGQALLELVLFEVRGVRVLVVLDDHANG